MKLLISIIVGILTFIGIFWGVDHIISWLISGFTDPNWRLAGKIILWIFGFGITLWVAIIAGIIGGRITSFFLGE